VLPVPLVPLACLPSFAVDRLCARRPLVAVVLNALVLTAIIHAAGALRNALAPGDADDLRWAVAAWSAAALATLGGYAWALLGRWIVRGVRLDWSRVGSTVPLFPEAAMAATAVLGATLWRVDPWLVLYLVGPLVILQRLLRFREVLVAPRTDGKTGPANYRFFEDCARRELGRSRRTGAPLALLVIDIDGLRDVNNTYGHPVGDRALLHVADVLRRRQYDVVCRFGGEEFLVLLPGTPLDVAADVAERLGAAVAAAPLRVDDRPVPVSVSIGAAALDPEVPGTGALERLLTDADARVYAARTPAVTPSSPGRSRSDRGSHPSSEQVTVRPSGRPGRW
jgi:diguanylate cyclase (GGDEF)-like protein